MSSAYILLSRVPSPYVTSNNLRFYCSWYLTSSKFLLGIFLTQDHMYVYMHVCVSWNAPASLPDRRLVHLACFRFLRQVDRLQRSELSVTCKIMGNVYMCTYIYYIYKPTYIHIYLYVSFTLKIV